MTIPELFRRAIVVPLTREAAIAMAAEKVDEFTDVAQLDIESDAEFYELIKTQVFTLVNEAANAGYVVENTGQEPLVSLRYFGPDTFDQVPEVGDYRNA